MVPESEGFVYTEGFLFTRPLQPTLYLSLKLAARGYRTGLQGFERTVANEKDAFENA